jgi:hypothetical protein
VLNAANEIAVREFIGRRLGFSGIPALVEATLDAAERQWLDGRAAIGRGRASPLTIMQEGSRPTSCPKLPQWHLSLADRGMGQIKALRGW